jgi:1-acyl-sn-glycerol-3-phosphate acyltransferase
MSAIRLTGMIIWSILSITSSIIVRFLTFSTNLGVAMSRTVWSPVIVWMAGIKFTVKGLENIPTDKRSYIVVSNHESVIDIPILCYTLPFNVYFVAKNGIKKVPFIGWYMHAMGMIFLSNKSTEKSLKSMISAGALIRKGKSVITFPEGTRSTNGTIGTFKKGTFIMAEQAGVDILPVKITGAGKIWPSLGFTIKRGPVTVSFGKPISTTGLNKETRAAFIEQVRGVVEGL